MACLLIVLYVVVKVLNFESAARVFLLSYSIVGIYTDV